MSDLTAVSLFAGIGGFDLAFERAGVRVVAAVEIDPKARTRLRKRFPGVTLFADVRWVTGDDLRAAGFVPGRGIIAGGWPCQGNSVAGRRGGLGDPRSGLWQQFVRLMAETHPAWFVGENVPGLLTVNRGLDVAVVRQDIAQLGYWWAERILDAQYFGVAQRRERLFFVGHSGDGTAPVEVLLEPEGGGWRPAESGGEGPGTAARAGGRAARGRRTVAPCLRAGVPKPDHTGGDDSIAAVHAAQVSPPLLATGARTGHSGADDQVLEVAAAQVVPLRTQRGTIDAGKPGDPSRTLCASAGGGSRAMVAEVAGTLQARGQQRLDADSAGGGQLVPVAADLPGEGEPAADAVIAFDRSSAPGISPDTASTLRTSDGGAVAAFSWQAAADVGYGPEVPTLTTSQVKAVHTVASTLTAEDGTEDGTNRRTLIPSLTTDNRPAGDPYMAPVSRGQAVRRLTPTECERLQGFPDGWTEGYGQSDAQRYKQLGNAVAVPVVEWIARRLVAADARREEGR